MTHLASKTNILERSDEVFRHFFRSDYVIGGYYISPLRAGDTSPSFNIFASSSNVLLFKDWGGNSGNCIDFVMQKENLNFIDALNRIKEVLSSKVTVNTTETQLRVYKTDESKEIAIYPYLDENKQPTYTYTDKWYWEHMHKTKLGIVKKHRVYSLKEVWIDGYNYLTAEHKKPIYFYLEIVDGSKYFTIYAPFKKEKKWLKNLRGVTNRAIHGMHLLPAYGEELIITKSVKDCVVLYGLGFNVVATQGEDIDIHEDILNDLKERFKTIYLLYDNDFSKEVNTGKLMGDKYQSKWDIGRILIPADFKAKDTSEIIQTREPDVVKKLINSWKSDK